MLDITLAGVLLAGLASLLAYFQGKRVERAGSLGVRVSASAFAADYFRDLRSWASEAVDVLAEASYRAPGRSDGYKLPQEDTARLRYRLSALIDRGRFLIPNAVPDEVGAQKESAYRGRRHAALDFLVAAERVLAANPSLSSNVTSQRSALVELRRGFVSELQELLDPRTKNREVAALLRETGGYAEGPSAFDQLASGEHRDFDDPDAA